MGFEVIVEILAMGGIMYGGYRLYQWYEDDLNARIAMEQQQRQGYVSLKTPLANGDCIVLGRGLHEWALTRFFLLL